MSTPNGETFRPLYDNLTREMYHLSQTLDFRNLSGIAGRVMTDFYNNLIRTDSAHQVAFDDILDIENAIMMNFDHMTPSGSRFGRDYVNMRLAYNPSGLFYTPYERRGEAYDFTIWNNTNRNKKEVAHPFSLVLAVTDATVNDFGRQPGIAIHLGSEEDTVISDFIPGEALEGIHFLRPADYAHYLRPGDQALINASAIGMIQRIQKLNLIPTLTSLRP